MQHNTLYTYEQSHMKEQNSTNDFGAGKIYKKIQYIPKICPLLNIQYTNK